jgi:hypothetical protein
LQLALFVGLGTAAVAAEVPDGGEAKPAAQESSSWWGRMFGRKDAPPAPGPQKGADAKKPVQGKAVTAVEEATAQRAREAANLMRRLEVCDKLRAVAEQTNDQELLRKAEQLDEHAYATYRQRTIHLPASSAIYDADERVMDKRLGQGASASADRLTSPAYTIRGKNGSGVAAAGEEKP